jgi:predicted nucleic acid-binding protein
MNVLVDSDILIEVFRGRDAEIVERWRSFHAPSHAVLYSPVSICELWRRVRPAEQNALERMFAALICLPVNAEVGKRAGDYLKRYSKSHSVEIADALIAATAAVHEAVLWTRNRKHYPMRDFKFL